MDPMASVDPELQRLVDVIAHDFKPIEIILFGSQARGEANDDSDFDVAVVMSDVDSRRRLAGDMYVALGRVEGRSRGIDIVVLTAHELEEGRDDIGSLTREIARDGITIYRHPVAASA
ncbi:MAG: nucleotidyltransferase domain-containing protein [Chloroflexota bacterium]